MVSHPDALKIWNYKARLSDEGGIVGTSSYRKEEQEYPERIFFSNRRQDVLKDTNQSDMRKCAWYAKGSGVVLIRSKFTTLSCRLVIALTIAVAEAGVSKVCRINHEKYVDRNSAISTGTFESAASGRIFLPRRVRRRVGSCPSSLSSCE